MILLPLYVTSNLVHTNTLSYIAFGCIYSSMLALIHSDYVHPWESIFKILGIGTSSDHHVHHALQRYNYGHLFMYWDKFMGTYRDPNDCQKLKFK